MWRRSLLRRSALLLAFGVALAGTGCGGGSGGGGAGFERIDKTSNHSFQDTLDRLTAAVRDANLVLVKEVDYQTMLKMVNMDTEGLRSYEVFHPKYGASVFGSDRTAGLDVPLRIFLREDGNRAIVSYYTPSSVLAHYRGLADLGRELDQVFVTMTDKATQ